jgi:hypothetical protein
MHQIQVICAAIAAFGLMGASTAAGADADPASCIADHADGQVLTRSGKFLEARARFHQCASSACPTPVQKDCRDFALAVERLIPTLRVTITDHDGRDLSAVGVEVDGARLNIEHARQLTEVNPGPHEFRFETEDHRVVQVRVFAKIGEKSRDVIAHMPAPIRSLHTPAPVEVALAGLGVVGLGLFAGFGLSGYSLQQDLDRCAPYCQNREQADRMRSKYLVADVSLGLGLVSLGTAAYLYLKRTHSKPNAPARVELQADYTGSLAPFRF